MKRRQFFATAAALSAGSIGGYGIGRYLPDNGYSSNSETIGTIGDRTLEEIREKYRIDLFNNFLPNMDNSVIDHENGGFMCTVDIRTGERSSTDKRAWYEGRGMWVYSFLYNNFRQDPHFLEIARKSKDFILQHEPADDSFWVASYSREGVPLSDEPGDIYGNLFIAEGLAQYAMASGENEYYDHAKSIILSCLSRYDQPDYNYRFDMTGIPAPRVTGHWMIFLRLTTQMLEFKADPEIEQVADRCVDAVMNYHLHPEYQLLNEFLAHDFSLPDNDYAQFAGMGHGIETLWMVMFEAARRKDPELFNAARNSFKRHVEVAWDAVYGGHFHELLHVDNYEWRLNKVLWLQEEVLVGSLFLIEHTGDPWAKKCFEKSDAYVREKFVRPGYKFWTSGGDRKVSEHNTRRAEHFHHPRHLMLNLLSLERMISRGGKVSGLFG